MEREHMNSTSDVDNLYNQWYFQLQFFFFFFFTAHQILLFQVIEELLFIQIWEG